jgi:hypothetical protein
MHENLKNLAHAPSVQMQNVPESFFDPEQITQEEQYPDICQDNVAISSERFGFPKSHNKIKLFNHFILIQLESCLRMNITILPKTTTSPISEFVHL